MEEEGIKLHSSSPEKPTRRGGKPHEGGGVFSTGEK